MAEMTTPEPASSCCSPGTEAEAVPATASEDIRETVREKYATAARAVAEQWSTSSCCGPSR